MGIKIQDPNTTYELAHPSSAMFVMGHWTCAMQDEADKQCLSVDAKGNISFDISKDREIKVRLSVRDWRGVESEDGTAVACTEENKRKLPPGVLLWLVREIDERAGLRIREEEKKN